MKPPVIEPKAIIFLSTKTVDWNDMDDVAKALKGKPVKISGTTVDLKGCQLSGAKLPKPSHEDSEDSLPLRTRIPGLILKNGSVRGIPGGIVFRKTACQFLDLVFLDIGEDGLSNIMDDSADCTVRRCQFFGASDKSLQLNDARNATVEDNLFAGGITGVRLQKKATKFKEIGTKSVKGNRFVGCETAWNIAGGVTVAASGNHYEGVAKNWVTDSGATFSEEFLA